MIKLLFVQFANTMFNYTDECSKYWDAFYERYADMGYWRGKYTFEIPKWIAEIDYIVDKSVYEREVFWCKHNIQEVNDKIREYKPELVFFSLMDCNKDFIESIVKANTEQEFIIGGYNDRFIRYLAFTYSNVIDEETIEDVADTLDVEYKMGTDYSLFKGETVLPRLTLSYGCKNHCKFCIVPHGKVEPIDTECIMQQVESFKDLQFRLIYIDDKTFGQCENYGILKDIYAIVKSYNQDFLGFVVQTTSGMLIQKYGEFTELNVKVAEIGMETYNDEILKKYSKPSSEHFVRQCISLCNDDKSIKLILNVVVGFPEETTETYIKTYHLLTSVIGHGVIGINPAIYTDYSKDDCKGEIDFQDSDNIAINRKFWKLINELGADKIRKNTNNELNE